MQDALLMIATIVAIIRACGKDVDPNGDARTTLDYCLLSVALATIAVANADLSRSRAGL